MGISSIDEPHRSSQVFECLSSTAKTRNTGQATPKVHRGDSSTAPVSGGPGELKLFVSWQAPGQTKPWHPLWKRKIRSLGLYGCAETVREPGPIENPRTFPKGASCRICATFSCR